MLHDRVRSDSYATPFTASSRLVARHQSQDVGHVGHVTWTPHYDDVMTAQCVCERGWSAAQCPYVDGHLAPITDWTSAPAAAVAASTFWGCNLPDDTVFACSTMPRSSSAVQCVQFGASYSPTDDIVHGCQLERPPTEMRTSFHGGRTSALMPMNCQLTASSSQRTFNNDAQLHQLTHVTHQPTHFTHQPLSNISSSSQFIVDDDRKHRFGTRPTRASTSIGIHSHLCTVRCCTSVHTCNIAHIIASF